MRRILVELRSATEVRIAPDQAHHLVKVLRFRGGESFVGLAGEKRFLCRLERREQEWIGVICEELAVSGESPLSITLAQSLLKKDKMDWVIQKAVELGVTSIHPVISARTEVRREAGAQVRVMNRWQRIIAEAVKQSGRSTVPSLASPVPLVEMVANSASFDFQFYLDEEEGDHLKNFLNRYHRTGACRVFVGPEGGWDPEDRVLFQRAEIPAVHLGERILRSETAPVAIVSILQYQLGDMG
ncbi:MAG: 16S rRNA (uracil(1498)-N(3))-methyltransferase [Acidobacteria bacterium]|nr:16S rRNA (uracil(1498)-N(3))-methyltransferase [Acidobacteriota bacterium]